MSIAFLMGVVYHGAQYLKHQRLEHQFWLWFWMWLAVAASLTLMNTYLIVLGLVFLAIIVNREAPLQHLITWLLFGISFFLAATYYGLELKDRGLLYTGFDDGFIEVTVRSLIHFQLGQDSYPIAVFIAALGGVSAMVLIANFLLKSLEWNAIRLVAVFLLLNAVGSILLNLLFGMNFPENRVGMYYIPLFLFAVAGLFDLMAQRIPQAKWLSLSFVIFPIHLSQHFNLDSTILWSKWHASSKIYNEAVRLQHLKGEPLMVSADYLNELGWTYYNFQNNAEMQLLQRDMMPDTLADYLIARPADFEFSSVPYRSVFHDEANNIFLLERIRQLTWSKPIVLNEIRAEFSGSDEFYELVNQRASNLPSSVGMWELRGKFSCAEEGFRGQLVITSNAENSENGTYSMIPLHWIRPTWNQDTLHIKRTFHFADDAKDFKIYFWNLDRDEISFELEKLEFRAVK